jgi:hypothetical protein
MKLHIPRDLNKQLYKEKSLIDHVAMTVCVVGPLASIPQAINIWTGNADGVSVITWSMFLIISTTMLIYALLYKLKALIISEILWILVAIIILIGIFIKT